MDYDKEQHGVLVCESFTCNFGPSRKCLMRCGWRVQSVKNAFGKERVVSAWEAIRVWSYPMRSVQIHTKQKIQGEKDLL
jgi:hypothetical protein